LENESAQLAAPQEVTVNTPQTADASALAAACEHGKQQNACDVCKLQAMIDALPSSEQEINLSNMEEIGEAVSAIYDVIFEMDVSDYACITEAMYERLEDVASWLDSWALTREKLIENGAVAGVTINGSSYSYATLDKFISALKQGFTGTVTITLFADVNIGTEKIAVKNTTSAETNITFDGDSFTLTSSNATAAVVVDSGTFTIKKGVITGTTAAAKINGGTLAMSGGVLIGGVTGSGANGVKRPADYAFYTAVYKEYSNSLLNGYKADALITAPISTAFTVAPCSHPNGYAPNGNETHGMNCAYCGKTDTQAHTWGTAQACAVCGVQAQAKIGSTYYESVVSAWNAAQQMSSASIELLRDAALTAALTLNTAASITWQGNGHTVTGSSTGGVLCVQSGTLILQSGTIENTGTGYALQVSAGGNLQVQDGCFVGGLGIYDTPTVSLSGGTFQCKTGYKAIEIHSSLRCLSDILATGYSFYTTSGNTPITDLSVQTLSQNVQVLKKMFSAHPQGASVVYGYADAPVMSVTLRDTTSATYQWYKNNAAINGATQETYTVETGLAAGSYVYYCAVQADGLLVNSNKATVTVAPKSVTPTITGTTEKTYNASTAVNTDVKVTLQGLVNGDETRVAAKATLAYNSASVGDDKIITAKNITLTGDAAANYVLTATQVQTSGKITKQITSIALKPGVYTTEKTYDGTKMEQPTTDMLNVVNANIYQAKFTWNTADGAAPKDAGSYTLTISIPDGENEVGSSVSVPVTIHKRNITVTPTASQGKIYGSSDSQLSYTITAGSLADGDALQGALAREAGETVGSYAIQLGTLASKNPNYAITLVENGSFTISPCSIANATISVTGTYVYTGTAHTPTLVVQVNGRTLTQSDYKLVQLSGNVDCGQASFTIEGQGNYTGQKSGTFTIEQIDPQLAVAAVPQKTYGDAAFALQVTHQSTAVPAFASSNTQVATVDANGQVTLVGAGTAELTVSLPQSENYGAASVSITLVVQRKEAQLEVSTMDYQLTYGDADFTIAYTGNSDVSATFATSNAAVATVDAAGNVHITGAGQAVITVQLPQSGNYTAVSKTVRVVVAPKNVTVTANNHTKIYGAADPVLTYRTTGLVGSDVLVGVLSRNEGENVGSYGVLQGTLTDANNPNYTITFVGATFTVEKADRPALQLTGQAETVRNKKDGKIVGLTTEMEYSTDGVTFTPVIDGNMYFSVGTYSVRYQSNANYNDSPVASVSITQGRMLVVTFVADGKTIDTKELAYGDSLAAGAFPSIPKNSAYSKQDPYWDTTEIKAIQSDITITAIYVGVLPTVISQTPSEGDLAKLNVAALVEVPQALQSNKALNTVEKIQEKLKTAAQEKSGTAASQNIAYYDVSLLVDRNDGKAWGEATEENMPSNGVITIVIPYPSGTDAASYQFTVAHMFAHNAYGKTAGDIETPEVTKTANGLQVTLTGLSPIVVQWTKITTQTTSTAAATTSTSSSLPKSPVTGGWIEENTDTLLEVLAVCWLMGSLAFLLVSERKKMKAKRNPTDEKRNKRER
jgi:hypothetical protein